jgi:hypothetical protein
MKKLTTFITAMGITIFAQAQQAKQLWSPINEKEINPIGPRVIVPQKYVTYHLVGDNLKDVLWTAPHEDAVRLQDSKVIVALPMPDGTMKNYRVVYAPVMAPELAAAYPNIKTFSVMGVDEPGVYGKLDFSEMGFHAWLRKEGTDVYIDTYSQLNYTDYISYNFSDYTRDPNTIPHCEGVVKHNNKILKNRANTNAGATSIQSPPCIGDQLYKYRLAVACTHQYAQAATGLSSPTVAQTLAKIVTTVNRVDGVYETDLACKVVLVPTETLVIFPVATGDPFTGNSNANTLINESQTQIDNRIGDANYDVGHTFSTGGGGLSTLAGICVSGQKAQSITGSPTPVGDGYDIDYVAHEMGHDFGGDHTFASGSGSCTGNQNPGTMVEPGSGITIMAYAGICPGNDDSTHSIPYFHTISFDEITANTTGGSGNSCPVITSTGNNPPVVTAPTSFTIPKSTPFVLTGSATDPDGDVVSYSWEEIDNNSTAHNWNTGAKPFFRNYNPMSSGSRMFPKLSIVLSGPASYTTTVGEFLPSTAQTLNFRLVARDNKMGGGGVCYSNGTVVNINGTAGPFTVTYPNTTGISWGSASTQTVTWAVAGTSATPVSCANVNILISYNGGSTFSTLMSNVPNSGSQVITVPTLTTTITTCRIKVEAVGNIFFDINDKNFTITTGVGINTYSSPSISMHLVPNPANDQVQINLTGLNRSAKNNLTVYDMLGNVVLKDVLTGKENYEANYDISQFAKGVYVVEVIGDNKKAVSRLIKQ